MSSKLDYLAKHYGAGPGAKDEKKKRRRKKPADGKGIKIIDNSDDWRSYAPKAKQLQKTWEDKEVDEYAPQIIEETPAVEEKRKTVGTWAAQGGSDDNSDASPPRRRGPRHDSDEDDGDASPPRRRAPRHDSDDDGDASPPRRRAPRHDSDDEGDASPPRRRPRHDSDSDGDASPPRRKAPRHDSDDDGDASPPRRSARHDSDDDGDASPPRRRKVSSRQDSDGDGDASPPRRRRGDNDSSPPRRPRSKMSGPKDGKVRTGSGYTAGLHSGASFGEESNEIRQKKREKMKSIDPKALGAEQETIYRDKRGRKMDMLQAYMDDQDIAAGKKKREAKEQYEWGTGIVQKEARKSKQEELAAIASMPFARTADDVEMNNMQKDEIRADDPMAQYMLKKRSSAAAKKSGKPPKPIYKGPAAPPNRFGIRPGYRWDGNDRGNGFERRLNEKSVSNAKRRDFDRASAMD